MERKIGFIWGRREGWVFVRSIFFELIFCGRFILEFIFAVWSEVRWGSAACSIGVIWFMLRSISRKWLRCV